MFVNKGWQVQMTKSQCLIFLVDYFEVALLILRYNTGETSSPQKVHLLQENEGQYSCEARYGRYSGRTFNICPSHLRWVFSIPEFVYPFMHALHSPVEGWTLK
jgi:hypothetical protein